MQNTDIDEDQQDALFDRPREHGDARRMLEILPKLSPEAASRLKSILLASSRCLWRRRKRWSPGRPPRPPAWRPTFSVGPARTAPARLLATAPRSMVERADQKRQEETRRGVAPGTWARLLAEPCCAA